MSDKESHDPLGISGTVIADKYKIGRAVGEGGFSVVYQAEHTIWQQPVAIKCFKILANAPEDQRELLLDGFIQEGKLMASLSTRSAAIVQARDVGTFTSPEGQWLPYMVLEWLEGKPLDVVLWEENQRGLLPRTLFEALALLDPAAGALTVAHGRGVAHRDVKPANFFVMGDARGVDAHVKVLDFGIAKVMADHAAAAAALAHTGKDITAFTPNYGAPEQFSRTHGATGPWTDVFAMALILVEMMRGAPALEGTDMIQMAVASRDPHRRPTPRAFGLDVTDIVEHVFLTALAVSPTDRYPTMGQFWSALHHAVFPEAPSWSAGTSGGVGFPSLLSGGGVSQRPGLPMQASSLPRMPQTADAMSQNPEQRSSSRGVSVPPSPVVRPSRVPLAFAGVAALALAAGGFTAYKITRPQPPPSGSAVAPPHPSDTPAPAASASAFTAAPARPATCPAGMVLIPGGRFFMGSTDPTFDLWKPAHKVTLDTFCIDIDEVTAGDYKACSDIGECQRPDPIPDYPKTSQISDEQHESNRKVMAEFCNFGREDRARHPINCVPWSFADGYCRHRKARLPTEAEWEYAARGSDGRKYPWGDEPGDSLHMNACGWECNQWEKAHGLKPSPQMYNTDDGFPGTAPVGSFPKGQTKFGANDFIGNVWEWTGDWFEVYKSEDAINPTGVPAGDRKAIRGGGFNGGTPHWLNPAFRYHQLATASAPGIGFRCAANL
jgi:formylglycine-generating enzyme required for sulfatase activity